MDPKQTSPILLRLVRIQHESSIRSRNGITHIVVAAKCFIIACGNGDVLRWYPELDSLTPIAFPGRTHAETDDIKFLFIDTKGYHVLVGINNDTWYAHCPSAKARLISKLKKKLVLCVAWNPYATKASTNEILVAVDDGSIYEFCIDGKEKVANLRFKLPQKCLARAMHLEYLTLPKDSESNNYLILIASNKHLLELTGGPTIEALFNKYAKKSLRACLSYESPIKAENHYLHITHINSEMIGIFWMSGAALIYCILRLNIQSKSLNGNFMYHIKRNPQVILYPDTTSSSVNQHFNKLQNNSADSNDALVKLAPPPSQPLSMTVTPYHYIFLNNNRLVAISRLTLQKTLERRLVNTIYGKIKKIIQDPYDGTVWMYSDTTLYEIGLTEENRNAWMLYLKQGDYESALKHCLDTSNIPYMRFKHGDYLFNQGRYIEAAKFYGNTNHICFEDACLKFWSIDNEEALLEYLKCRMKNVLLRNESDVGDMLDSNFNEIKQINDSATTRQVMLYVWIVKLSLHLMNKVEHQIQIESDSLHIKSCSLFSFGQMASINNSNENEQCTISALKSKLDNLEQQLICLLHQFQHVDQLQATISNLLQSNGRISIFLTFCKAHKDYESIINHYLNIGDFESILESLKNMENTELLQVYLHRLSPFLFDIYPMEFTNFCLSLKNCNLELEHLIPVFLSFKSKLHVENAIRLLEEYASTDKIHTAIDVQPTEATIQSKKLATQNQTLTSFSAGKTFLWNSLLVLYSMLPDSLAVLRFLSSSLKRTNLVDVNFAIRLCAEKNLIKSLFYLYKHAGLYQLIVETALSKSELQLAKEYASSPRNPSIRKRLWIMILEHEAKSKNAQKLIDLCNEAEGAITLIDIIPRLSDSAQLEIIKDEFCHAINKYEKCILEQKEEIESDQMETIEISKKLAQLQQRHVTFVADQQCDICNLPLYTEKFYAFLCHHFVHAKCLLAFKLGALDPNTHESVLKMVHALQDSENLLLPDESLEIERQLDQIVADECIFCGIQAVDSIKIPFINGKETIESNSWSL